MMLIREQQAIDATYLELHSLRAETRISTMAAQMDAMRREQRNKPTPRKSTLELQMDRERRQKREDRRKAAERMMSYSTKSYSTKARVSTSVIGDCYELKKKLPLSAQKQFEREYNETPYGLEAELVAKYKRLYRL